jgi:hypothetical protein
MRLIVVLRSLLLHDTPTVGDMHFDNRYCGINYVCAHPPMALFYEDPTAAARSCAGGGRTAGVSVSVYPDCRT